MSALASLYAESGRLEEAVRLHTETLEARRRVLGENHRDTLSSVQNLAATHYLAGNAAAAVPLFRENIELRARLLGDEHPATLRAAKVLGQILLELGRFGEAERIYGETLPVYVRTQSADHRVAVEMRRDLGRLACRRGEAAPGLAMVDEALESARVHFAADALLVGTCLSERGRCLTALERFPAAEASLLEGQALLAEAQLPIDGPEARARQSLVELYEVWGKARTVSLLAVSRSPRNAHRIRGANQAGQARGRRLQSDPEAECQRPGTPAASEKLTKSMPVAKRGAEGPNANPKPRASAKEGPPARGGSQTRCQWPSEGPKAPMRTRSREPAPGKARRFGEDHKLDASGQARGRRPQCEPEAAKR